MTTSTRKVSLTGIQSSGEPHIGNYVGAIRPALKLAEQYESMYFIADYHALTTVRDPEQLRHYIRSVAATWLACGLDPDQTLFYRQSDIPEIFQLNWVLACVTGKGLLNRAHSYKAAVDKNREAGKDDDESVNMGLYNYPVLMAADILIMDTDVVPVGKDQIQHVEYAADMAGSFNHLYGKQHTLTVPTAIVPEGEAKTLPGLDGRKMSKSYENTIPLFAEQKHLKKLIRRIPSDSTPIDAPKDPDSSHTFHILEEFASPEMTADTRRRLEEGRMGWGDLKNLLFETLNEIITPMRDKYTALMQPDSELDAILAAGAEKARKKAQPLYAAVRHATGLSH